MRFVLRRARAELAVVVVTVVVLALAAGSAGAGAAVVRAMTTDGVREALRTAGSAARGLTARRQVTTAGVTVAQLQADGRDLRSMLDPAVRRVTAPPALVVDSPRLETADPVIAGRTRVLTIRAQPAAAAHTRVVDGHPPRRTGERLPLPAPLRATAFGLDQHDSPVIEVAVTRPTATALRVHVGDELQVTGYADDPYVAGTLAGRLYLTARITGIVALDDPSDAVWFGDAAAHTPTEIRAPGGTAVTVFATALTTGDTVPDLAAALAPVPLVSAWRYPVAPRQVNDKTLGTLRSALRREEQRWVTSPYVPPDSTAIRTSLATVLDEFAAARAATLRTMALAGVGCAGVLVAVLLLLAGLRSATRRPLGRLLRARGASTAQLVAADAIELCVAAAVAVLLAGGGLAVTAPQRTDALALTAGVAGLGAVALLAATLRRATPRTTAGVGGRRLVVEVAVVGLAVGGAVAAGRRGVVASGDATLLAVPAALGLAAGLVLVRLLPRAADAVATSRAGDRSTVIATGLRRLARGSGGTALPVLAVTVAAATMIITAAVGTTVDRALDRRAWMDVGAPARLDGAIPPGVAGAAPSLVTTQATVGDRGRATLLALAPERNAALVAGTPADTDLTPLLPRGPAVPVITSPGAIGPVGARGTLRLPGRATVPVVVRATRDRFPTLDPPFVVASLPRLAALTPTPVEPNRWYLTDDAATPTAARTRTEVAAVLHAAPLVAAGRAVFLGAAVLAGGLAVVAVGIGLALTSRARCRDAAYLRAIGLSRRQAAALLVVEVLPPLLVATVVGVALGTGIIWLLGRGLGLAALAGGTDAAQLDPVATATVTGLLVVTLTAATVLAGWRERDPDVTQALRTEDPW